MRQNFDAKAIEVSFSDTFYERHRTILVGGGNEPEYLPAGPRRELHTIVYRHDYVASALHEVAHWCIAGAARRRLPDFGYWYAPDGRSPSQQREFELVEAKPQALEWIFADALGLPFELSADNVASGNVPSEAFAAAVRQQKHAYLEKMPKRAALFRAALQQLNRSSSSRPSSPTTTDRLG